MPSKQNQLCLSKRQILAYCRSAPDSISQFISTGHFIAPGRSYIMGTTAQDAPLVNDHWVKRYWSGIEEVLIESCVCCHWKRIMIGICLALGTVISALHLKLLFAFMRGF